MINPIQIDMHSIDSPVFLAPMAGITDMPFRKIVQGYGAQLTFSEMIISQELVQERASTQLKAELGRGGGLNAIQIAGRDVKWMAEAARIAEASGADIIDINMGCPAKKVTGGYSGSALMKTPDLALCLIQSVVSAVKIPVTLKMRLGWDQDCLNAPDVAKRAEEAGIKLVTIHGRTRNQFYKGSADWYAISTIKRAISIPVIANGDICNSKHAQQALHQSGADGIMIGRGAQGKPWIIAQIAAELKGIAFKPPNYCAQGAMIVEHYESILSHYGIEQGVRCARKHLKWHLAGIPGGNECSIKLMQISEPDHIISLLQVFFSDLCDQTAA